MRSILEYVPYEVGKFFCTDEDNYQYCKRISSMKYQFTQIQWFDSDMTGKDYCVLASDVIDVSEMSIENIELAISGFYPSLEEMVEQYGKDMSIGDYAELIAECAFENETGDNSISDVMTLEECAKFQYDWMLKNS